MGKVCKYSANILLMLALVGGIIVASEEESFAVFMYFAIGSYVLFLLIYGLGEKLDLLTDIRDYFYEDEDEDEDEISSDTIE